MIGPSDLALLGPRDAMLLRTEGVASLAGEVELYRDSDLLAAPLEPVMGRVLERMRDSIGPFWLHVDLDVLSSDALPALDYRQPGGLSWQHLETLTGAAVASGTLIGWDVTIYNPDLDVSGVYARRILEYVSDMLGLLTPHQRGR